MTEAGWFRVLASAGPTGGVVADLVTDALWQHAPPAVEERADGPEVVLLAGFPSRSAAEAAATSAREAGARSVEVLPVLDDGLDAWREHATAHRAGPFLVTPPWLAAPADADGRPLVIDPGRTFGSGSHPTSRLVLELLAPLVGPGASVLDVGCGSGILAVGAAALGASAHGVDVDPAAPAATLANATANGVADRVTATNDSLGEVVADRRTFDVVVANLLAPILVELAEPLVQAVAVGGHLVVSGLLADRWEPTVDALVEETEAMEVVAVAEDDGWVAVHLTRTGAGR